ncbi:MAG TPA: FlgD immunoglobulin-like domain containing protein [Acidobacteriota bacterium]|nr:FlgD immunoglobulin-like domain containing protein [Acidobacteriota bacterium]
MSRSVVVFCFILACFCLLAQATSFILLSRDELVSDSDAVVRGRVSSLQSIVSENGTILTFIGVTVERDLLRQIPPQTTIYFEELGGRFEGTSAWVFGAPEVELGEDVVIFAKLQADGFFRIAQLFQGKFGVEPSGRLRQEMPGAVGLFRRDTRRFERLEEIEQVTANTNTRTLGHFATELRLAKSESLAQFSFRGVADAGQPRKKRESSGGSASADSTVSTTQSFFTLMGGGIRWREFDSGGSVSWVTNPASSPVGSVAATLSVVNSAVQAWNTIAGTRIRTANGSTTSLSGRNSDGANVISFGDPQGIITDPVGCAGILAITYVTFSSTGSMVVNGTNFKQIFEADIVFNNGFDCFLSNATNLAEVLAHELGHGIGMGHSSENAAEPDPILRDALMYYRAHGDGRGASVRVDDIRAAQFVYPSGSSSAQISGVSATPFVISPNGDALNDTLTIQFTLSASDQITVEILDHNGVVVAVPLNASNLNAGGYSITWNGVTSSGATANDGMYTFRIRGVSTATGNFGINNTIPEVSTSWFLAEGSTVGFQAYILIQNPNDSPVTANVTFFKQDGTTQTYSETVAARTRTTVPIHREVPNTFSVSSRVTANLPIIVERAMYFNNNNGGHDTIGAITTNNNWFFPANHTFAGDEDFILIVNPSGTSATTITATYIFENRAPLVQTYPVGPNTRFTIPVHGIVSGVRVSVRLQSTLPIAAERAFYINNRTGGAAGVGAVSPSLTWYFAEGDTSNLTSPGNATTILELANPGSLAANVTVNYLLENGSVISKAYSIGAQRRLALDAATEIGAGQRFSMEVISDQPIVAERLMFSGTDVGDSVGSPTTAYVWNLAEGFTAFGYETWVLVSNPGNQNANVTVRFLQQNGQNVIQNYAIGAKQRLTVYVNNFIPATSVSTQVTSDQPIVVERTMKFSNRLGIHQSMGVRQ